MENVIEEFQGFWAIFYRQPDKGLGGNRGPTLRLSVTRKEKSNAFSFK